MSDKHLNIFFPEWQGYAEDNLVSVGAAVLKNHLHSMDFQEVVVEAQEDLPIANNIIGYEANLRQLKMARKILEREKPSTTFMIGGTCASEIGPVSYLNNYYQNDLAVLWFDAHGDLNTPHSSPSKHFHGMPLRTLLGDSDDEILHTAFSTVTPERVFVLGGREFDEEEITYIKSSGLHHYTPQALSNPQNLIDEIKGLGCRNLYVHVDLDVLEPTEFPHMLLPIADGLGVQGLLDTINLLKENFKIVGSSIVEYVPKEGGDLHTVDDIIKALGI